MGYLIAAATLTFGIIGGAGLAYVNRDDPAWRRAAPFIRIVLLGQACLVLLLLVFRVLVDR